MVTRRPVPLLLALAVASLLCVTVPASAERVASRTDSPAEGRAADLAKVSDATSRVEVARALAAHGLTGAEVEDRLARLSDEDLRRLAANIDQVQAAGQVPNYIWILLGIFLAVSIIIAVF